MRNACMYEEVIFMETSERDVAYELDGQLFVWDKIKATQLEQKFWKR